METKHTKGKWVKRNGDSDCRFDILGEFGTNKTIATIPSKCFVSDEEAEANAKLIASAPKLLQTLLTCESITDRCNNAMLPQHIQELLASLNSTMKQAINEATL